MSIGGIPTLIGSAHTASNATSVDITSGIDDTYVHYMFVLTGFIGVPIKSL